MDPLLFCTSSNSDITSHTDTTCLPYYAKHSASGRLQHTDRQKRKDSFGGEISTKACCLFLGAKHFKRSFLFFFFLFPCGIYLFSVARQRPYPPAALWCRRTSMWIHGRDLFPWAGWSLLTHTHIEIPLSTLRTPLPYKHWRTPSCKLI